MKKFKLLSLLLIITLFAAVLPVPALALDTPELWAQTAVVMDTVSGEVLFQKNGTRSVEAGTMTQLMTALLVGEAVDRRDISLDDAVTASENFSYNFDEATTVVSDPAIGAGETLTVENLLYLMLYRSAEDAANILAEYVSGSAQAFIDLMNARAAELGCTGTHFTNASGVSAVDNVTSANDAALFANAAFKNATVRAVLQGSTYTTDPTEVNAPRTVSNPDALLDEATGMKYEYATAGMPAYAYSLGYSIAAAATFNEIDVVAVAMGCPDEASMYSDPATMFGWVFNNFSYRTLLSSTDILTTVPVEMGSPEAVSVRAESEVRIIRPNEQELGEITYEISYQHELNGTPLVAPVEVGVYLGDVTVFMNGVEYGSSRLVAASAVDISRTEYLRSQLDTLGQTESVRQIVKVLVIVLGVYLLLVFIYLIQRVRHMHSLRKARKARARAQAQQEVEWLDVPASVAEPEPPAAGYIPEPVPQPVPEPVREDVSVPEEDVRVYGESGFAPAESAPAQKP